MEILSEAQYEVLSFTAACNRSHYNPTTSEVELWQGSKTPTDATYRTVRRQLSDGASTPAFLDPTASTRMLASLLGNPMQEMLASLRPFTGLALGAASRYATERELVTPAETMLSHLIRLKWLAEVRPLSEGEDSRLQLTELGRALLRDAEYENEDTDDVSVVVLGRGDPLAYPVLVGQIAAAGPGLLVDPYLKLADLHTLAVSTQISRLLVSGKSNNRREVAAMRAYLGQGSISRSLEVRASTGLHDRVLIADDGDVITVGTSLNGVGKTTTVMSPVPSPSAGPLKSEYERLWDEAVLVGPEVGAAGSIEEEPKGETPS